MTATEHVRPAENGSSEEMPVNPTTALRVAYGMLLGEDDFRTLMGHARGKHMLHGAWLHLGGVIWGFGVTLEGRRLRVSRGLALDALGRELVLEADHCAEIADLLAEEPDADGEREVTTFLVARYATCLTSPVPALLDPCDVSRKHTDFSRVVESVWIGVPDRKPTEPRRYHRVRVLLGLDRIGDDDPPGEAAADWRRWVAQQPARDRARALKEAFRVLAAHDGIDLTPLDDGADPAAPFPVTDQDADVVLARIRVRLRGAGCEEIVSVSIDPTVRRTLLPTGVIQELTCGFAPAVLGVDTEQDAGGPRIDPRSLSYLPGRRALRFGVTGPLLDGLLERWQSQLDPPVVVTSLSDRGWVREDIARIVYDPDEWTVTVQLHDAPAYDLVRLLVRGTGPTPVVGIDYVPLAGVAGGPPGSRHDGHDAVLTLTIEGRAGE